MQKISWDKVFACSGGVHFFPIGDGLLLRVEIDGPGTLEEQTGEAVVVANREHVVLYLRNEADLPIWVGAKRMRLFFRGHAITLKNPVEMSGEQWTPQGTLFGSTYEPGYPPEKTKAESRDKWLDGALLKMVRQAKAMKLANQRETRPRR
jgi:hypothetical protein